MSLRDYEMVMKSVADPTRVRILKALEAGEMCVCQIVAILELGQSTVSKHLFLLKMAGLVKERQEKKWVHYSLDGSEGVPYARKTLNTLKGWLNDDPVIGRDRKREALAREIGPAEICERGMTLPGRGTRRAARPPERSGRSNNERKSMKIAILGTGCPKCKQTAEVVRRAVEQAGIEATIYKVEEIQEIVKFKVMMTPAVAVDGQVRISGKVPTVEEVKALLAHGGEA